MTINGDMELSVCTTQTGAAPNLHGTSGLEIKLAPEIRIRVAEIRIKLSNYKHKRENMINYEVNYLVNLDMC